MARGGFDPRFAAKVIAEALRMGHEEAARRFNVSTKTVARYLKRLEEDPALSELVLAEDKKITVEVTKKRRASLEMVERKMVDLCQQASPGNLGDVVEAFKALSERDLTSRMLDVRGSPDSEDSRAAADAGDPGEGEGDGGSAPH